MVMMIGPMPRFDITIAGELNLDLIIYGLPDQLPPERELLANDMTLTLGGSSAIVAHNLAALGRGVGFISRIGADPLGEISLGQLTGSGVDVSNVRRVPGSETGITVTLERGRWRNMLTYAGTIAELAYEDLDLDYLTDSRHFHFCSYYLQRRLQPRIPELFQHLKSAGLTISLDTNDDPEDTWQGLDEVLPYVDVLLPNAREVKKIAGSDDLETAITRLAARVPLVVVKQGESGALAQQDGQRYSSPAVRVTPVDAVGAGDSFNAGFLSEYVRGASIPACLKMGNLSGALSTTRPGGVEAFRDARHRASFFRAHDRVDARK